MDRGEIIWQKSGSPSREIGNSGTMTTDTLVFYKNSSLSTLNAIDKETGEFIHAIPLQHTITGVPMTYMLHGRQYIVVATGRQDQPMQLIALALP